MTFLRPLAGLASVLLLAGCFGGGAPPETYVLGKDPVPQTRITPESALPIVLVRSVIVPDYLDNTDIQTRDGNRMRVQPGVRWGERLSLGATHALTAALGARLPQYAVTSVPPVARPARQVLVELSAFEPQAGGPVILSGRWTLADAGGNDSLATERLTLTEASAQADPAGWSDAMTRLLGTLADHIAAGLARNPPARAR